MPRTDLDSSVIKALDDKDRVGMASRHARWLTTEVTLCPGPARNIEIRALPQWEEYKAELRERGSRGPRQVRDLVRHIIGHAQHVRVDGQGRIRLNADLRKWARIPDAGGDEEARREVKILGMGDFLEVWSLPVYEQRRSEVEADFEATFDEMMGEAPFEESGDGGREGDGAE